VLLSVFTPSHTGGYLDDCYQSLLTQTHEDWEWIVLLNGDAADWQPADPRVTVTRAELHGVGAAKAAACSLAAGQVLVELDHDDMLLPDCLHAIDQAFAEHLGTVLVYSDFAQINADAAPNLDRFDPAHGWRYSTHPHAGQVYLRCHALPPLPHNIGLVWYAPNHVRAFRADTYRQVGGHDPSLTVLDDQELMIRLYQAGEFSHLDELLYLQRVHPANTQRDPQINAHIQEQTVRYYRQHLDALQTAWAARHHLAILAIPPLRLPDWAPDTVGVLTLTGTDVARQLHVLPACWEACAHGAVIRLSSEIGHNLASLQACIPALPAGLRVSRIGDGWADLLVVKDGLRLGG
jgi:hypothetical protein